MTYQPLLHVLSQNTTQIPQNAINMALQGRVGQDLARSEIELKKAIKTLSKVTGVILNDPPMLTALSFPNNADAVLWTSYMLFNQAQQPSAGDHFVQKRNRDSRTLLDALSQLKIEQWYQTMVTTIDYASITSTLRFPAAHPQPDQLYRQHFLPICANVYYPVDSYFVHIFEERKREYLQIFAALGATKITVQACTQDSAVALNEQVFEFAGHPWSSTMTFDRSKYKWLSYDPNLQALVDGRLNHGLHTAKFEINLDVDNILASRFRDIETFLGQLESLDVGAMVTLLKRSLRPQIISVEFEAGNK